MSFLFRSLALLVALAPLAAPVHAQVAFTQRTGSANPMDGVVLPGEAASALGDLDNDTDFDLVTLASSGPTAAATSRYFRNTGSRTSPTFSQQSGNGISNAGSFARPMLVDIDNDGDLDVVTGNNSNTLAYHENTGTELAATFARRFGADSPFDGVPLGFGNSPALADIDGDGDFDLLVGANGLRYYENTGSRSSASFTERTGASNPFDGLSAGSSGAPTFLDADGDGDFDVVTSNSGGEMRYFENQGSRSSPSYALLSGTDDPFDGVRSGRFGNPTAADLNGDGRPDLLVGNQAGQFVYFENIAAAPTTPEISIEGNGTTISNGDFSPRTFDDTDFEDVEISSSRTRTFTIRNTGSGALSVGTVTSGGSMFTISSQPSSSVASNGSTTFSVRFSPTAQGQRQATISIPNNDADENPYTFVVGGNGVPAQPEIRVRGYGSTISSGDTSPRTSDGTDFGSTPVGGSDLTSTFTIENTDPGLLTIGTITRTGTNSSDFTITQPGSTSLADNTSTTFVVTFRPSGAGQRTATISIPNNDADENPYTFAVEGSGTQTPPTFSKAFTPSSIQQGGRSTLTFTIDNTSSASAATSLAFQDNLPAGMTIASPLGLAVTCSTGFLSVSAGGSSITYSGGTVGASASCTISVDVTAGTTGELINTSGDLTSSAGNSGTASASLFVTAAAPTFALTDADPDNARFDVPRDTVVAATFDADLDQATVTTGTFTVRGSQTGERAGAFTFSNGGTKAQFNPAQDFLPGEVVTVTASSGVQDAAGTSLTPYTWQFSAKPDVGPGTFGQQNTIRELESQGAIYPADLDGDGDLDLVAAASDVFDDTVGFLAWYENDGAGGFTQRIINSDHKGISSVHAADINGDGNIDVVGASRAGAVTLAWYAGDGSGGIGPAQIVTTNQITIALSADVDGDGDLDLIGGNTTPVNPRIWLFENQGSGSFAAARVVAQNVTSSLRDLEAADLDGDGDLDLVSSSSFDDKLAWYANDGSGTFGSQQIIADAADGAQSVYTADVDGDGDVDVLVGALAVGASGGSGVWLYESDGAADPSFTPRRIANTPAIPLSVYASDVDGDGDLDVLSTAGSSGVVLYESDGAAAPGFSPRTVSIQVASAVYPADVDGDGDLDLFSAFSSNEEIAWFEQTAPTFALTDETPDNARFDVPRDTVVAATFDANLDQSTVTNATFVVHGSQTGERAGTFSVSGSKAEFDPTLDFRPGEIVTVTASSGIESSVGTSLTPYWWQFRAKPDAGPGTFAQPVTTSGAFFAIGIEPADLDGDGDLDLVVSSTEGPGLYWVENEGGTLAAPQQILFVDRASTDASSIAVADLNGDGHLDLVSRNISSRQTLWFENDGAADPTFTQRVVGPINFAFDVVAGDLDGDGDIDLISTGNAARSSVLSVYVNDGTGTFTTVAGPSISGGSKLELVDVDGDGDADLLSTRSEEPSRSTATRATERLPTVWKLPPGGAVVVDG